MEDKKYLVVFRATNHWTHEKVERAHVYCAHDYLQALRHADLVCANTAFVPWVYDPEDTSSEDILNIIDGVEFINSQIEVPFTLARLTKELRLEEACALVDEAIGKCPVDELPVLKEKLDKAIRYYASIGF